MDATVKKLPTRLHTDIGRGPGIVRPSREEAEEAIRTARLGREAFAAGLRVFGENKVQEAIAKSFPEGSTRHFIGHLQSNKVSKCVAWAAWPRNAWLTERMA